MRIEIIERKPFAEGMPYGQVGPYEVIRGRLHYAINPVHPRNRAVDWEADLVAEGERPLSLAPNRAEIEAALIDFWSRGRNHGLHYVLKSMGEEAERPAPKEAAAV